MLQLFISRIQSNYTRKLPLIKRKVNFHQGCVQMRKNLPGTGYLGAVPLAPKLFDSVAGSFGRTWLIFKCYGISCNVEMSSLPRQVRVSEG